MPVGNIAPPDVIHAIDGVDIGITAAGVRYKDRDDLVVFRLNESAKLSCVTTTNKCCAAPVLITRQHLSQLNSESTPARYLLINTGNANAATGTEGYRRAIDTCQALADKTQVAVNQVLPFSTGVIGENINSDAIIQGLDRCLDNLSADNWLPAANAIRTTDTIPKVASTKVLIDDSTTYHITGISKGAGMIRPNMATMLGYVATDAPVSQSLLDEMLLELTNQSFNRITIDGDTSTNDCCVLVATGDDSDVISSKQHPHYSALFDALKQVFVRLATLIVRDGEGATKFITVNVTGGKTTQDCCDVAYAVAHSPLVKTAFFASDPNWGRIIAAVGYSGAENLDANQVSVTLDDIAICTRGQLDPDYTEEQGQEVMSRPEITINIDLGLGSASDTVYTCDLSHDYVSINADYRS